MIHLKFIEMFFLSKSDIFIPKFNKFSIEDDVVGIDNDCRTGLLVDIGI